MTGDGHLIAAYGQEESWTLGYNLFADVWLGTNVVESSVSVFLFMPHLDTHPSWFPGLRWPKYFPRSPLINFELQRSVRKTLELQQLWDASR